MNDLELMETTEVEGTMEESKTGKGLGAAIAIGAGLVALGGLAIAGVKKFVAKKRGATECTDDSEEITSDVTEEYVEYEAE